MFESLKVVPRVQTRDSSSVGGRRTNDLILRTSIKDGKTTEAFKFSTPAFRENNIDRLGITLLKDAETKKVYIALLAEEDAGAFKGRNKNAAPNIDEVTGQVIPYKKALEGGYNEIVDAFVEFGAIPSERPHGFRQAFNLLSVGEDVVSFVKTLLPSTESVLELEPTELLQASTSESEDKPEVADDVQNTPQDSDAIASVDSAEPEVEEEY